MNFSTEHEAEINGTDAQHSDGSDLAMDPTQVRILDAAEALFMQDGFAAVSLRQVADAAGIRQATLYYHFPGGKEALYVAMARRFFAGQQAGLARAIDEAEPTLAAKVDAVFHWLGNQRAVHYMGMMYVDLPALDAARAQEVSQIVYASLFSPLSAMFAQAMARGEARPVTPEFLAGAVIALADGITFSMTQPHNVPRVVMEKEMARLILDGVTARAEAG